MLSEFLHSQILGARIMLWMYMVVIDKKYQSDKKWWK